LQPLPPQYTEIDDDDDEEMVAAKRHIQYLKEGIDRKYREAKVRGETFGRGTNGSAPCITRRPIVCCI
jgi:hypothetical protein